MTTNSVRLHRVLRASPETIYRAFTDAAAWAKWLPPFGFTATVHAQDLRVGGSYRMSFTQIATGFTHAFGGDYRVLEPGAKVVYTATFDDPGMPGQMQTTVVLTQVSCGTAIEIEQQGIPDVIPVDGCYLGWQQSLIQLAQLVEG